MLTDRERIVRLEDIVVELRAALPIAGAFTVTAVQAILDQMVDEQLLPAATRTEIFGRLRRELSAIRIGSEDIERGARNAIPYYRTRVEADEAKQRSSQWRKDEARIRKEMLQLPIAKPESDQ